MDKVLKEVLENISPTKEEKKHTENVLSTFVKKLQKLKIPETTIVPGGSASKDTWLAGGHDADIFFAFKYSTYKDKNQKLSDILELQLKKHARNCKRLHGSRDYFQVIEEGFVFEIVPILKISKASQALNITDVSILHTKWVLKNSTKKLRD